MKRREEIQKAAFEYINSDAVSPENMQLAFGDFINGAKWADKTMIEKAKAWVKNCFIGPLGEGLANNIANEFAKYLEE